jgi:hypothetical protein
MPPRSHVPPSQQSWPTLVHRSCTPGLRLPLPQIWAPIGLRHTPTGLSRIATEHLSPELIERGQISGRDLPIRKGSLRGFIEMDLVVHEIDPISRNEMGLATGFRIIPA